MLSNIFFKKFRSFKDAKLPLGYLTVLIGANASGKSNAIEGLRLLSWLAKGNRLSLLHVSSQESERILRGRVDDLPYLKGKTFILGCQSNREEWHTLSLQFENRNDGLHINHEYVSYNGASAPLYELDTPSEGIGTDVKVAYNNFSKGPNKPHITCIDQNAIFTQLVSPATFDVKHHKAREKIPLITKSYLTWLSNVLFLDPVPARMRDYSFRSDIRLLGDGRNLSSVLYHLWGEDINANKEPQRSNRANILSLVQSLPEQEIESLGFLHGPREEVMVQLVETFGGQDREWEAALLSDGTLRVLAIAAAMLSAPEDSLVVIEEIDNGVHPSRAQHLLQQIQTIAQQRSLRVLLSTHNPALLDALPDIAIPDVVFCYRDISDGSSKLIRLRDLPDYPELIAQGTLGDLMTSGVIDRFVKFHPGSEEKKRQALEWLESRKAGGSK
jgi:predicted ATPase